VVPAFILLTNQSLGGAEATVRRERPVSRVFGEPWPDSGAQSETRLSHHKKLDRSHSINGSRALRREERPSGRTQLLHGSTESAGGK